MFFSFSRVFTIFLLTSLSCAQEVTVLDIDVANTTAYHYDSADYARFATDGNAVNFAGAARTFGVFMNFGDIVAVNGQAARGTWVSRVFVFRMSTTPVAGSSIGDSNRFGIAEFQVELQLADGTAIGSLFMQGQNFGSPVPGAPAASNGGSFAIVGGTGAFFGARGQMTTAPSRITGTARAASVLEDPVNRRNRGGAGQRMLIQLVPMQTPEAARDGSRVQLFHSDFSVVSESNPARAGEQLILYARGLGLTSPPLEAGRTFGEDPLHVVVTPVQIVIGSNAVPALNQVGVPGTGDVFRVDFRVPEGLAAGRQPLQVRSGWVTGPAVSFAIQ